MKIEEWIPQLEPEEQSFVRRSFRAIKGGNGKPDTGKISQPRADILFAHTQVLAENSPRKRKPNPLRVITLKLPYDLHQELLRDAAEVDINVSAFVRACIVLSSETIKKRPLLLHILNSVIPK